jgi:hypothetical protein
LRAPVFHNALTLSTHARIHNIGAQTPNSMGARAPSHAQPLRAESRFRRQCQKSVRPWACSRRFLRALALCTTCSFLGYRRGDVYLCLHTIMSNALSPLVRTLNGTVRDARARFLSPSLPPSHTRTPPPSPPPSPCLLSLLLCSPSQEQPCGCGRKLVVVALKADKRPSPKLATTGAIVNSTASFAHVIQ